MLRGSWVVIETRRSSYSGFSWSVVPMGPGDLSIRATGFQYASEELAFDALCQSLNARRDLR